jgi:hypothetical protein
VYPYQDISDLGAVVSVVIGESDGVVGIDMLYEDLLKYASEKIIFEAFKNKSN